MKSRNTIRKEKYKLLMLLNTYMEGKKIHVMFLIGIELFLIGYLIINPLFYQFYIDRVLMAKELAFLKYVIIGQLLLYVVHTLLIYLNKHIRFQIVSTIMYRIRKDIFDKFLKFESVHLNKYVPGEMKQIIFDDFELIEKFFSKQVIDYSMAVIFLFIFGIAMLRISVPMTVFSCVFISIPYIADYIIGKINYKRAKEKRVLFGKYENFLHFSLQSWREIKALSLEKKQLLQFLDYRRKIAKYDIRSGYWDYLKDMINFINESFLTKLSIYFLGGLLVMRGDFSIGSLLVFLNYYSIFYKKATTISTSDYEFNSDLPSFLRISEVLSREVTSENREDWLWKEDIVFDRVFFKYPAASRIALQNVSFSIKKGEKVAFIGKSGSGKSTLIKLLLKLYGPTEGKISVDGYDIKEIPSKQLRKNMNAILQESLLFNISIKENLLLIKPEADDNEIISVCKRVYLSDFIEGLPQKYNTVIGERGIQLSGGQKQCLNIARLLLNLPNIIILDEAMSALDMEKSEAVQNELFRAARDSTIIIISHNLHSTINVDRIFLLEKGEIIASGTHNELLLHNEVYRNLYMEQTVTCD